MPRYPNLDPDIGKLGDPVFRALARRFASLEGEVYPLFLGDTWMQPDPALDWASLDTDGAVKPHRYCKTQGVDSLLEALVEKVRSKNRIAVAGTRNVLVTAGATGALTAAGMATLEPGDEVLVLAPFWALILGTIINCKGVPVPVPVLHQDFDPETIRQALRDRITKRTVAIYINTPNNPTGRLLALPELAAVAEVARAHDLWIWSDEVYEDYAYSGDHHSIATLAPEHTLSVFSFSKAYGMAGYRCGYLVGPPAVITAARKAVTSVWYNVATPSQLLAERVLSAGEPWLQRARTAYQEVGNQAADRLGVARPEGGTFLFIDVGQWLDERGLLGFLEDCLDDNLMLAPGTSFGPTYTTWIRLCFTCSPPDLVIRGVELLAHRVGAS